MTKKYLGSLVKYLRTIRNSFCLLSQVHMEKLRKMEKKCEITVEMEEEELK